MKKALLALGVLIGSLGIYGLADGAEIGFGTPAAPAVAKILKSDLSFPPTCARYGVTAKTVIATCSGSNVTTSTAPPTTTTTVQPPPGGDWNNPSPSPQAKLLARSNVDPATGCGSWWVNNSAWSGSGTAHRR